MEWDLAETERDFGKIFRLSWYSSYEDCSKVADMLVWKFTKLEEVFNTKPNLFLVLLLFHFLQQKFNLVLHVSSTFNIKSQNNFFQILLNIKHQIWETTKHKTPVAINN